MIVRRAGVRTNLDFRIWLLALGTFAIGTDVFVISGILPAVAAHFGVSLDAAGQAVTAYALSYAVIAPAIVPITATLKQSRVVCVTLAAFAVANALCAMAPTYGSLVVVRVAAGAVAAVYTSTAYALAASLAPADRKGAALAAVAIGLTASAVFGVPIGTAIGEAITWQATFWLITALATIAVVVLIVCPVRETPAEHQPLGYAARFAPLRRPDVLLAMAPSLLWNTGQTSRATPISARYWRSGSRRTQLSRCSSSMAWAALSAASSVVAWSIGSAPFGRCVGCLALAALNQSLMGLSYHSAWAIAAALAVWSITGWGTFAPQQSRLIALAPNSSALVIALNHSIIYIGAAVGSIVGGFALTKGLPLDHLHWVTAGLLALALLTLLFSVLRGGAVFQRAVAPER